MGSASVDRLWISWKIALEDYAGDRLADEGQVVEDAWGPIALVALGAAYDQRVNRHGAKEEMDLELIRLLVKDVGS